MEVLLHSITEQIGNEEGNGNSYSSIEYRFLDESPEIIANYYRLKQIDFDGQYEDSGLVRADNIKSRIRIYHTTAYNYIHG